MVETLSSFAPVVGLNGELDRWPEGGKDPVFTPFAESEVPTMRSDTAPTISLAGQCLQGESDTQRSVDFL